MAGTPPIGPRITPKGSSLIDRATNGSASRKLTSWIDGFLAYTENLEASPLWRKWAGIATIAATLERKVWVRTTKGNLYPNMYTVLVGYAGTGKSVTITAAEEFLRELEDPQGNSGLHLAPTSMTMASLVDELNEARRSILRPGLNPPHVEFNALSILADELSALIHTYDREFMAGLTKIYDGGTYAQSRRGGNLHIKIQSPTLNILAGTTPSSLCQFMPEGAWDQGFASRIVMVYSGDRHLSDIFSDEPITDTPEYRDLLHDLRNISTIYGQLVLNPDTIETFRAWREAGEQPAPNHPKLVHYCSRRTAHLLKLCMVASVSRGEDKRITLGDFRVAQDWLLEAELMMPDIFLAGVTGGDSTAIEEAWYFVWANWSKNSKRPIPEHELVHFVRERVPSHSVLRTIEIMEKDGTLKSNYDIKTGTKFFEPGPRRMGG